MSVTLAKVLNARPVEVGENQLDLFAEKAPERESCHTCPTPELCYPDPPTCWKR
jgi:hypothetical protein